MKLMLMALGAAFVLAGCAAGIQSSGSPSVSYTVPRNFETVYLRVQHQANECLTGHHQYGVYAQLDSPGRQASVVVKTPVGAGEVARTELKALDARNTQVTHTVWGHSPWDARALQAMRESVLLDTTVCVVYR
ncbi:MAG: hypothetical protein GX049_09745 [Alcaligenaceae bacterium]|nr:hypothetical protein [Alcaligenaceae bacterium]